MKLKKKHFKRLKEIAEKLNHELNYSGLLLSDLITDIGAVQKVKPPHEFETVHEKPITGTAAFLEACAKYQEEFYANYLKQGESMVAASTDETTIFKGGLRDAVEALSEPKIGDLGYFWCSDSNYDTIYGKIKDLNGASFQHESENWFPNFSKTPPELK